MHIKVSGFLFSSYHDTASRRTNSFSLPITDKNTKFFLAFVHYRRPYQQIEVIGEVVGFCLALGCHGDQTGTFSCVEPDC